MKTLTRFALTLAVGGVLISAAIAANEQPAAKGKKKGRKAPPTPATFKLPDAISLSAEQQAKFDELKTQYSDKLRDAMKKVNDVFTAEQLAARKSARQTAAAEGKKGKQLQAAVESAVQLSDEQKQKLSEAQSQLASLQKEVREKLVGLLTDDQKVHIKVKSKKKKDAA